MVVSPTVSASCAEWVPAELLLVADHDVVVVVFVTRLIVFCGA